MTQFIRGCYCLQGFGPLLMPRSDRLFTATDESFPRYNRGTSTLRNGGSLEAHRATPADSMNEAAGNVECSMPT